MTDIFTRLGLTTHSFAESGITTGMNENAMILAALAERRALARQSTLPSSPTPENGDVYITIPGSPSPTNENYLAIYVSGGWEYVAPQAGWIFWVEADAAYYVFDTSVSPNAWVPYTASGGVSFAVDEYAGSPENALTLTSDDNGKQKQLNTDLDAIITLPTGLTSDFIVNVVNLGTGKIRYATQGSDALDFISLIENAQEEHTIYLKIMADNGVSPVVPSTFGLMGVDWDVKYVLATQATPPSSPAPSAGDVYLVANGSPAASGAWAGLEDYLVIHNGSGWEGKAPYLGQTIYDEALGGRRTYAAAGWVTE